MVPRPLAEQLAYSAETGEDREQFIYGTGDNICAQTGYRGRAGIYEVLPVTDELRQHFLAGAPRQQLWEQALKDGIAPLRKDGMLKVKEGIPHTRLCAPPWTPDEERLLVPIPPRDQERKQGGPMTELINSGDPIGEDFPTGPAIGERVPDFTLLDQFGNQIRFSQARGNSRALVLFNRSASW